VNTLEFHRNFWDQKTSRVPGLLYSIVRVVVLVQCWLVTDGQTTHNDSIYSASIVSHGKNYAGRSFEQLLEEVNGEQGLPEKNVC